MILRLEWGVTTTDFTYKYIIQTDVPNIIFSSVILTLFLQHSLLYQFYQFPGLVHINNDDFKLQRQKRYNHRFVVSLCSSLRGYPTNPAKSPLRGFKTQRSVQYRPISSTAHLPATGGSSGIGLSIATYFATHGAHISIFDLDKNGSYVASDLQSKHAGSKVEFYTCDVVNWETQAAAFKKVWEKEGAVHYVFANAGIAQDEFYRPDEGEPVKPNLKTLDVCLNGAMYSECQEPATDWKLLVMNVRANSSSCSFGCPLHAT